MTAIPGVGPQLERAADGTDPRGRLVFEYLPADLRNAEDSTQAADFERAKLGFHGGWYREISARKDSIAARDDAQAAGVPRLRWLSWSTYLRDATASERRLLVHLGYELPAPTDGSNSDGLIYTRCSFLTPGVRRRTWPQLETN